MCVRALEWYYTGSLTPFFFPLSGGGAFQRGGEKAGDIFVFFSFPFLLLMTVWFC